MLPSLDSLGIRKEGTEKSRRSSNRRGKSFMPPPSQIPRQASVTLDIPNVSVDTKYPVRMDNFQTGRTSEDHSAASGGRHDGNSARSTPIAATNLSRSSI